MIVRAAIPTKVSFSGFKTGKLDTQKFVSNSSEIGCFTCHAPHDSGNFSLRTISKEKSDLCANCHRAGERARRKCAREIYPRIAGVRIIDLKPICSRVRMPMNFPAKSTRARHILRCPTRPASLVTCHCRRAVTPWRPPLADIAFGSPVKCMTSTGSTPRVVPIPVVTGR